MSDITTLGIAVDSSGARTASTDMASMARAARDAADAATALEKEAKWANSTINKTVNAQKDLAAASAKAADQTKDLTKETEKQEKAHQGATKAAIAQGVALGNMLADAVIKAGQLAGQFLSLGLSLGRFQDLADLTQTKDPAGLAAMDIAAQTAGVSIEFVATSMTMLSTRLAQTDEESGKVSAALKAIGLNVADLKKMDPQEQYRAIALALSEYADGAGKVAIAQALFGRGGAQQLRVMKEIAEQGGANNIITNEQIRLADDMSDRTTRMKAEVGQMAAVFMANANPAVNALSVALRDVIKEMVGAGSEASRLRANQGMKEFAEGAITALTYLADTAQITFETVAVLGANVAYVVKTILRDLGAVSDGWMALSRFDYAAVKEIATTTLKADADARKSLDDFEKRVMHTGDTIGQKLRSNIAQAKEFNEALANKGASLFPGAMDQGPKKEIDTSGLDGKKAKAMRERVSAYDALMGKIKERMVLEIDEMNQGEKLDAAERYRAETSIAIEKAITSSKLDAVNKKKAFTKAQEDEMRAALTGAARVTEITIQENMAREKAAKALHEQEKALARLNDERAKEDEALMRSADHYEKQADAAERKLAEYGKTREGLEALDLAETKRLATEKQLELAESKATDDWVGMSSRRTAALQAEADALNRAYDAEAARLELMRKESYDPMTGATKAVKEYVDDVAKAGKSTHDMVGSILDGTEDMLTKAFTGKPTGARDFVDKTIAEFMRLTIIKPMMADLMNFAQGKQANGWLGQAVGLIGGLFGGGGTDFGIGTQGAGGAGTSLVDMGLGAGRAGGGDVNANSRQQVNERGPELLTVGGQDFLMMGSKGGKITPNDKLGGGGGGNVNVTQYNSFGAGVSPSQLAKAMYQAKEQAKAEIAAAARRGGRNG